MIITVSPALERVIPIVNRWKRLRKLQSLCGSLEETVLASLTGSSSSMLERNYVGPVEKNANPPLRYLSPVIGLENILQLTTLY